jgi:hypothetical protein
VEQDGQERRARLPSPGVKRAKKAKTANVFVTVVTDVTLWTLLQVGRASGEAVLARGRRKLLLTPAWGSKPGGAMVHRIHEDNETTFASGLARRAPAAGVGTPSAGLDGQDYR